jgi:predicted secreted Zn-dependent protease
MPTDNAAVAKSIAAADKRLETLLVLCGILSGRIEASRRDLRQIRADVASDQKRAEETHAAVAEISADMLAG